MQQSKARFPPLSLFCSLVFEKSLALCQRVAGLAISCDAVSVYELLSKSVLLRSVIPFMVSNLTTLITTGRDWVEELGKQVIALLYCLDTIGTAIYQRSKYGATAAGSGNGAGGGAVVSVVSVVTPPKPALSPVSPADVHSRYVDTKDDSLTSSVSGSTLPAPTPDDEAETLRKEVVSTVVESAHPYADATRKTYTLTFPSSVSVLVLEFDPVRSAPPLFPLCCRY